MNEKNLIKLNFKKISKDNYEFIFNCGDLFTRENVSLDKDLEYCIKIFKNVEFKNIKSLKSDHVSITLLRSVRICSETVMKYLLCYTNKVNIS